MIVHEVKDGDIIGLVKAARKVSTSEPRCLVRADFVEKAIRLV